MTQQIWYVILYFKLSQALQGKFSYYEMITEFITAFCILLMYTYSGNSGVWMGREKGDPRLVYLLLLMLMLYGFIADTPITYCLSHSKIISIQIQLFIMVAMPYFQCGIDGK